MREPTPHVPVFGLMAEFAAPDALAAAVRQARAAGYRRMDALTPFPVEGLAEALAFSDRRIPLFTLAGGIAGAAAALAMQIGTNHAYPILIGGRPLQALPAFLLITFELMVLGAVLAAILGMLALNHLPRLNHPVFENPRFSLADGDRFFLLVFGDDPAFDAERTRAFLAGLSPVDVAALAHTEEPE